MNGASKITIRSSSAIGVARAGKDSAAPPASVVTPEVRSALIEELFSARKAAPEAGVRRNAIRTFAVAAIIKPDGTVSYESAYYDVGMAEYAEPQLLTAIALKGTLSLSQ